MLGVYDRTALIKKSEGNFIFVAGNYRMRAFGWLAGNSMEKESHSNIGLYGKRLFSFNI